MTARTTNAELADELDALRADVSHIASRLDDVLGAIDEVLGVVLGVAACIEGEDD